MNVQPKSYQTTSGLSVAEAAAYWQARGYPAFPQATSEVKLVASGANPSILAIVRVCARYFDRCYADVISPERNAQSVHARQVSMYLSQKHASKSLPEIGRHLGHRDHTTVLHGVRKIAALMKTDPAVRYDIEAIERILARPADVEVIEAKLSVRI